MFETTVLTRDDLRRHLSQGRTYVWPPNDPDARRYVSVTTALDAIPKPFLTRWAAKVTAETAVEKLDLLNTLVADDPIEAIKWLKGSPFSARDKAADSGTAIHLMAELDADGRTEEADEILASLDLKSREKARQCRHFFTYPGLVIDHSEFVVYNDDLGYAGTGDFIVTLPDTIPFPMVDKPNPKIIVDLKTGKGVYSEVALQLAAYRYATSMVDLATAQMLPVPEVDGAAVLHPTESGWSLIPVDASPASFEQFKAALAMSAHTPLSNDLIGTPILKGKA